jgi:hypothetical protein
MVLYMPWAWFPPWTKGVSFILSGLILLLQCFMMRPSCPVCTPHCTLKQHICMCCCCCCCGCGSVSPAGHMARGGTLTEYEGGGPILGGPNFLTLPCDVLIPAALGGVITAKVAERLQCKVRVILSYLVCVVSVHPMCYVGRSYTSTYLGLLGCTMCVASVRCTVYVGGAKCRPVSMRTTFPAPGLTVCG